MSDERISLQLREQQAGKMLVAATHSAYQATVEGIQLIDRTLNEVAGHSDTQEDLAASLVLLARVFSDWRGVTVMVEHGYAQQAGALAAAAADAAFAVATVAGNRGAGIKWLQHRNGKRTPERTSEAIAVLARRLHPADPEQAREAYSEAYSMVSMSKHGNPMVVSGLGLRVAGNTLHVSFGPSASELDVIIARDAMLSIAVIVGGVLRLFTETYERSAELRRQIIAWLTPVVGLMQAHKAEVRARGLQRSMEPPHVDH